MNFKEFATMIRGIKYSLSDTSVFEDDIPVEYCVGHRFEISLFIDGNGLNAKLNPIEDSNHPYIYYKDLLKQIEIVENNVVNTDDINIPCPIRVGFSVKVDYDEDGKNKYKVSEIVLY